MIKVAVYNSAGMVVGEEELDAKIFGVKPNSSLLHQAVIAEQAKARQPLAHTKTRAEVRGGGKKPWKQKGTGRARHGSIRSPIWRGGGIAFGPRKTAVFEVAINKQMKRKALLMTLSDKVANSNFVILEDLKLSGKTKDWLSATTKVFKAIGAPENKKPKALVLVPSVTTELKRATKNIRGIEAIRTDSLNVQAVLGHKYAVITVEGIKALEKWLKKSK